MNERIKELYKKKLTTAEEAVKVVKSGYTIVSGLAAIEPRLFLTALPSIKEKVKDVAIVTCLPMAPYEFFNSKDMIGHFLHEAWFYTPPIRKAPFELNTFIPNHLHSCSRDRMAYKKPTIIAAAATPPDKHGYMSLSLSAMYEIDLLEHADYVILEVNENYPRTFGDIMIHINDVTHIIEADYKPPVFPQAPVSDKDRAIAGHITEYLEDGITLQLGIGGIPNAVGAVLTNLKDVGIHTEMLTDSMAELFEAGVINGKKKTLFPNKMVCTFALGSEKLYQFIDNNPGVVFNKGSWVNNPYVISQNYKQVSINTSLEIDLTGQVCSESIGPKQFSGTGGQADTAIGAQMSPGGKSFISLYSTANVDNEAGKKVEISKIVPMLKEGAQVTLHRANVDYVVTEHGCVRIKGCTVRERAKRLISIAHPDFRDWLTEEARKLQYL